MEQRELELASDHCRDRRERLTVFGQAFETPADHLTDALGQSEPGPMRQQIAFGFSAHRFHGDERIAFTRRPGLLTEPLERGLVGAMPDGAHEALRIPA